jgi:hypothetical protein
MAKLTTNITDKMFRIYVDVAQNIFDKHVKDLRAEVAKMKTVGMDNKNIMAKLEADRVAGTGIYADMNGALASELNNELNLIYQSESNNFSNDNALYLWQLDPAAQHCDSCLYQAARGALPISAFPVPSYQETHGETNCNDYCKCTLVPA